MYSQQIVFLLQIVNFYYFCIVNGAKNNKTRLEVQLAVYGADGMNRLVCCAHPRCPGVKWRVAWQLNGRESVNVKIPEALAGRDDFSIEIFNDKGVAINRNHLLQSPTDAEFILFGDDDTNYSADGLNALIIAFDMHPAADVICCRYTNSGVYPKPYSQSVFNLLNPPRGWYVSLVEMAVRRDSLKNIKFADSIGSTRLFCGEETILLHDLLKAGKKGLFVPIDICTHDALSTGERMQSSPDYAFNYGAVLTHIKPLSWPLRILLYSYRSPLPFIRCLKHTFQGAIYALRTKPFKTERI